MFNRRISIDAKWMPLVLAALFVFLFNIVLFQKIYVALSALDKVSISFIISIPVFLVALFNILFNLLCFRATTKPLFAILILASSVLTYAAHAYGIVFDKNMIVNFAETNIAEATSYLCWPLFTWAFLGGVLPALVLLSLDIRYPSLHKTLWNKMSSTCISLLLIGVIGIFHFKDYASFIRNNPLLRKEVIPIYAIDSTYSYIKKRHFKKERPMQYLALDAQQSDQDIGEKKELLVLIVGETQRSMNYELNGYMRETNKYTRNLGLLSFQNATSCGTATAISVPCMFSNLTREGYDSELIENRDNLLDIAQRAGVNIVWLDNDNGCKGVCARVPTIDLRQKYEGNPLCDSDGCKDGVFLTELAEQFKKLPDATGVIVLHLMGSHGPTYYKRYPESHRVFTPDCQRSDIQNCTHEELVNTYDNTILYSDYVIAGIIDFLKAHSAERNAALLFVSDHGESLGEKGIYLHGMPYLMAPKEQTNIPFMAWIPKEFAEDRGLDKTCVHKTLLNKPVSHDNLFHTVLGLLMVTGDAYRPEMDVFTSCAVKTKDQH